MANLYQINQAMLDLIDEVSGEMSDYQAYADLVLAKEVKIENTALYIKNLEHDLNGLKNEISNLQERVKQKQTKVDSLKSYLQKFVDQEYEKGFETSKVKISFRKSTQVYIENESLFKKQYPDLVNTKVVETIDKASIKDKLKTEELKFAKLVTKKNLQIK